MLHRRAGGTPASCSWSPPWLGGPFALGPDAAATDTDRDGLTNVFERTLSLTSPSAASTPTATACGTVARTPTATA